ncbi:MAG: homocysteine S-methyltransferase family protein [Phycisphaerae bacterium]|nr:homocysteine S-methyltransferase family protein [Phycisphaerae bacterium]MCZ2401190.1 homocysteine S-methyltransferase family protein [Phycisphaerae bacterium]
MATNPQKRPADVGQAIRNATSANPLIVDGATGTELTRRGVPTPLPLWSAGAIDSHPDVLRDIHRDYVQAGARIIVANTFRTNVRTLRTAGLLARGGELNRRAIALAWAAAAEATSRRVWVAASVAPVEDCYRPERVPPDSELRDEHAQMMAWLRDAGADLVWIETMNTLREARVAAAAAHDARLPFVVNWVLSQAGALLGGDSLEDAVKAVEPFDPLALGLNCIPPEGLTRQLPRLRACTRRPLIAYAHIGNPEPIMGWSFSESATPAQYAAQARTWIDLGATLVGGCCGTTPAHIVAVSAALSGGRAATSGCSPDKRKTAPEAT